MIQQSKTISHFVAKCGILRFRILDPDPKLFAKARFEFKSVHNKIICTPTRLNLHEQADIALLYEYA